MANQQGPNYPEFSEIESISSASSEETNCIQRILGELNFTAREPIPQVPENSGSMDSVLNGMQTVAQASTLFLPPTYAAGVNVAALAVPLVVRTAASLMPEDVGPIQAQIDLVTQDIALGQEHHLNAMEHRQSLHERNLQDFEHRRLENRLAEEELREECKQNTEEFVQELKELEDAQKEALEEFRKDTDTKLKELEKVSEERRRELGKNYKEEMDMMKKGCAEQRRENISRVDALRFDNEKNQKIADEKIQELRTEAANQRLENVQQSEIVHHEVLDQTVKLFEKQEKAFERQLEIQLEAGRKNTETRIEYIRVMVNISVLESQESQVQRLRAATLKWFEGVRDVVELKTTLLQLISEYNLDKPNNVYILKRDMEKLRNDIRAVNRLHDKVRETLTGSSIHRDQNILNSFNTARDAVGLALTAIVSTFVPIHDRLLRHQDLDHSLISQPFEQLETALRTIPELCDEQRALTEATILLEQLSKNPDPPQQPQLDE
ncbi:unnamed protein product [Caenorhabditis auriculariae]|uniref:Uncharacterized protein n=1 Tax=Caenorhabditis auriculariae TaxID=2777116 RepID=A0A8S1HWW7_9PELO|nr:unnamed protein product [Caenorhabditis auriculariae]